MREVLKLGNIIFQTLILFVGSLFFKTKWWLPNVALDEGGGFGIINGGKLMKLLFKFGIPLVMIGLAILSHAKVWGADWRLYANIDLYECFYDAEGIVHSSQDMVRVWAKLVYTERGVVELVKEFGKHYENLSYSLELWEINCAEKKHRLLSTTAYSVEGNILYTNQAGSRPPALEDYFSRICWRESIQNGMLNKLAVEIRI